MHQSDTAPTRLANTPNARLQRWTIGLLLASLLYVLGTLLIPGYRAGARDAFVTRSGSQLLLNGQPFRFSGPNIFWLGLDEQSGPGYPSAYRVNNALDTTVAMGGTVVRAHTLGVSFGCAKCLMPTRGMYNEEAFRQIDYVVKAAGERGLRLIIPLMDEYDYYHGGRKTFTDWRGLDNDDDFWSNPAVVGDFTQYITTLINRTNSYTGVRYRDDPTILAWETGNELTPTLAWTNTVTQKIKQLDPNHLIIDGTYGVRAEHLRLDAVDIYSDHFYPRNTARLVADAAQVQAANKVFYVGEYDWVTGSTLDPFLRAMETHGVAGDSFWSLFSHGDNGGYVQHDDGSVDYALHYPGDNATMRAAAQTLRAHAYRMRDQATPPAQTAPPAPQILRVSGHKVTWRGAAGAATYRVERAPASGGPWTALCTTNCPTDSGGGWADPSAPNGTAWYRLTGVTPDGVVGAPSTAVQDGTSGSAPVPAPTVAPMPTPAPDAPAPASVPTFGVNLNGPAVKVDGLTWLSYSAAQARGLKVRGGTPDDKGLKLNPPTDADTAKMLNGVLYNADQTGMGLTMPVPNGSYQVYLWVMENYKSQSRSWSLSLEGRTADRNLGLLEQGGWAKYGPYNVTVTDGTINIDLGHENGSPMLSGFSLYQAGGQPTSQSREFRAFAPLLMAYGK